MNKTHDTPKPARFSKEDLLKEVRNLVLLDARSRSWVYDPGAAYRLLGWKPTHGFGGALLDIELYDFDEAAEGEGQSANLGHLPLVQVFEQLYDYGVLGLRRQDMEPLEPATMPAFVACWMNDVHASMLVSEAHNGQQPSLRLPGITIDLALARAVLDGVGPEPRFVSRDGDPLYSDHLTYAEVALLAGMDERSVRNAASKPDSGLTTVASDDGRKSFINADVARAWLKGRRGFVPTRDVDLVEHVDILARPFDSAGAVVAYLRLMCERRNIDATRYADLCGWSDPATVWSDARLPETSEAVHDVANAFDLDPVLFDLRLKELRLAEEMEAVRRSLKSLREEKTDAR